MAIINNSNIQDIRNAFSRYFPEDVPDSRFIDGKYSSGDFSWSNRKDFVDFIAKEARVYIDLNKQSRLEVAKLVKQAQQAFEGRALHPEKAVTENMPTEEAKDVKAMEKKEAERQKVIQESNQKVRAEIESLQKNHEKLAGSKNRAYLKVEEPTKPKLSEASQSLYDSLIVKPGSSLEENPSIPNIAKKIEESISPSLSSKLNKDQIHLIAVDAAYKAVDAANNPQKYLDAARQAAILNTIAKDNTVIPKVVTDVETLNNVRVGANELSVFQNLQTRTASTIWGSFNGHEDLAKYLFPDSSEFQISLSETQLEGYSTSFNPDGLIQGYSGFLQNNVVFFGKLLGLPVDRFEHEIMSKASTFLEGQIVRNFPQAAEFFASPESELIFRAFGLGTTTIDLSGSFGAFFIENPAALNVANFFGGGLGINFSVGSLAGAAESQAMTLATAESVSLAGGTMASEAFIGGAAVAAAPETFGLSLVVAAAGYVQQKVLKKLVDVTKDVVSENGPAILVGAGALLGGGIAFVSGLGIGSSIFYGILSGGGTYAASSFFSGGTSGMSSALSSFGSGVLAFFDVLWATFLAGIAGPIVGFLIGFPLVVALILFIINSGAYVVPPGQQFLNETNQYISVEKTSSILDGKAASPTSVTYTVTITAKKDSLTGITIKADCTAIKKGGSTACPAEQIPSPPQTISAGAPFTFTFNVNYGAQYQNALVTDNITVNANSISGGKVTEVGSASVCFGDCPLNCFDFSDPSWKQVPSIESQFVSAASKLAGSYPNFAAKVCAAGTVKLCYTSNDPAPGNCVNSIYGKTFRGGSCTINFNKCASQTGGPEGVLYILTHEVTHHIQYTSPNYQSLFEEKVPRSEWNLCTYGGNDPSESMAEGDAMYIANPVIYAHQCVTPSTYSRVYPYHYRFAKDCMFGSACSIGK